MSFKYPQRVKWPSKSTLEVLCLICLQDKSLCRRKEEMEIGFVNNVILCPLKEKKILREQIQENESSFFSSLNPFPKWIRVTNINWDSFWNHSHFLCFSCPFSWIYTLAYKNSKNKWSRIFFAHVQVDIQFYASVFTTFTIHEVKKY